ncbi:MAG TPA: hypothetical protein VF422_02645 [Dokdonella sp.]
MRTRARWAAHARSASAAKRLGCGSRPAGRDCEARGESVMKGLNQKKNEKKKPEKTMKEKRAEKKEKKASKR